MKYSELKPIQRITVLQWMKRGLLDGMATQIKNTTYGVFGQSLKDPKKPFSSQAVWDAIHVRTQEHLNHAAKEIAHLDDEIEKAEKQLEGSKPKKS